MRNMDHRQNATSFGDSRPAMTMGKTCKLRYSPSKPGVFTSCRAVFGLACQTPCQTSTRDCLRAPLCFLGICHVVDHIWGNMQRNGPVMVSTFWWVDSLRLAHGCVNNLPKVPVVDVSPCAFPTVESSSKGRIENPASLSLCIL
jgi:hypothetical protein